MNYIYDIYLNLNEKLYDSFDWNKHDKIIHIKKIPIFRVDENTLKEIISNKIEINTQLLAKIKDKTEIYGLNLKIPYCALFSDASDIIALEFSNKGISTKKSYLLIDEELEIMDIISKIDETKIDIKIINKEKNATKTRNQLKEEKFINNELKNMDEDKLNYIFFECFGRKENNRKTILKKLNEIKVTSDIYKNLYDILKLTSSTKK